MATKRQDTAFRARIAHIQNDIERQQAIEASKVISLHAYHRLAEQLNKVGSLIHQGKLGEAFGLFEFVFNPDSMYVSSLRWSSTTYRQLLTKDERAKLGDDL